MHACIHTLGGNDASIDHPAETDCIVANVDKFLHFTSTLGQNFAHFQRDKLSQWDNVLAQLFANLAHNLATLRTRQLPIEIESVL